MTSTAVADAIDAFERGSSAARLLRLACPADTYAAFAATWAYFRWADDTVDVPGRDAAAAAAFVADQRALLTGARAPARPEEVAWQHALAHPTAGEALRAASLGMLDALAWDATRAATPPPRAEIDAQIARIGDAYVRAVWACTGAPGEPVPAAFALARAATAAHHVRDRHEDLALGYCNAAADDLAGPVGPAALDAWAARRRGEIDADFARALGGLAGVPWRTRLVLVALGWRYRLGLRRW